MRVLLAEDDCSQRGRLSGALMQSGHEVVSARDGIEALHQLRDRLPDVLVLDMVMPKLDGLAVLTLLPGLKLEKRPAIIAALPCESRYIKRCARALGASKFFLKPLEPDLIEKTFLSFPAPAPDHGKHDKTEEMLRQIGIPLYTKGGIYLMEAIALTVDDFSRISRMRDGIYAPIAEKYDTRPSNVERLIRHAIETACVHGRLELLHGLFGYTLRRDTGKPTNAEFIALLAENIRREA